MKKLNYLSIGLGSMILICLIFVFFMMNKIPELSAKIIAQEESASKITQYFESNPTALVENVKAAESFAKPIEVSAEIKHAYHAPDGIMVASNTDNWDEGKLKLLYEELMKNEHGEEMKTLHEVFVHGENDENAAATHSTDIQTYQFKIDFPAIPSDCEVEFSRQMGTINIYDGDKQTTIESIAVVLSHEYGHHYTLHYMLKDDEDDLNSEYAKIRNLPKDKVSVDRSDYDYYVKNHHWYLIEIAADDYVQLMGSPTAKSIVKYNDVEDYLRNRGISSQFYSINATPQENFLIPLAYETPGLYDYFYSFIDGGTRPKPATYEKLPINISIQRKSKHHELMSGPVDWVYYEITWNKPYNVDGVVYTLVYYEPDNYDCAVGIKTIYPNQTPISYIGNVSYAGSSYIYSQDDNIAQGKKAFVVTAVFPDGTILKSDPVTYDFK